MLDLETLSARDMDSSELTEAIRERTEGVNLDGAVARLRAYDVRRGVASGVDRALLHDLQRRCLNFSLEIHAEELPGERAGLGGLRAAGGGVHGVRKGAAAAGRVGGEVRGGVSREGA